MQTTIAILLYPPPLVWLATNGHSLTYTRLYHDWWPTDCYPQKWPVPGCDDEVLDSVFPFSLHFLLISQIHFFLIAIYRSFPSPPLLSLFALSVCVYVSLSITFLVFLFLPLLRNVWLPFLNQLLISYPCNSPSYFTIVTGYLLTWIRFFAIYFILFSHRPACSEWIVSSVSFPSSYPLPIRLFPFLAAYHLLRIQQLLQTRFDIWGRTYETSVASNVPVLVFCCASRIRCRRKLEWWWFFRDVYPHPRYSRTLLSTAQRARETQKKQRWINRVLGVGVR